MRNGAPVANAVVTALVWPSPEVLAGLPDGAAVDVRTVATVRTSVSGAYALDIDWSTLGAAYIGRSGTADVEVVADDGTGSVSWDVPVAPGGVSAASAAMVAATRPAGPLPAAVARAGSKPAQLTFELGSQPGVTDQGWESGSRVGRALRTASDMLATAKLPSRQTADTRRTLAGSSTMAAVVPMATCLVVTSATLYNLREEWGRIFAWSGVDTTVTNQDGNSHTLGVGLKEAGGSWSASGTVTIAESSSNGGSMNGVKDAWISNRMNYREYHTTCPATSVNKYERKPLSTYAQLTDFRAAGHPTWTACTTYTSGTFYKNSATNITVSSGMDIAVLSVSAQAGWNSSTELKFVVRAKSKYCGSSAAGPGGSAEASMSAG